MSSKDKMLSVAEVCELMPGDSENASWINPGFIGVIRKSQKATQGKPRWIVIVADAVGSATIETAIFSPGSPKFEEGDTVEFSGKGLRRTEYNNKPQFAVGKDTEIHILGKSVHHGEQREREASSEPSQNGQAFPVNGQTVGMAMKEAIALVHRGWGENAPTCLDLADPKFWKEVHAVASQIIRVARYLEAGKLAPKAGAAQPASSPAPQSGGRSDPPPVREKPQPGPGGSAFPPGGVDDDVPF